jgi:hypothetical protein
MDKVVISHIGLTAKDKMLFRTLVRLDESWALFQTMFMLFDHVLAVFMEKNTRKHSKNSSLCLTSTLCLGE